MFTRRGHATFRRLVTAHSREAVCSEETITSLVLSPMVPVDAATAADAVTVTASVSVTVTAVVIVTVAAPVTAAVTPYVAATVYS